MYWFDDLLDRLSDKTVLHVDWAVSLVSRVWYWGVVLYFFYVFAVTGEPVFLVCGLWIGNLLARGAFKNG